MTSKTHYSVLGLDNKCTQQEIRKSYFELCKILHPDVRPEDAAQHKKFIELNEAYTTLINAKSRNHYDNSLVNGTTHWTNDKYPWKDETMWYARARYQDQFHENKPKYNMKGVHKKWIVVGCMTLIIFGSLLYISAYRFASTYFTKRVDEKSRQISLNYRDVRKKAFEAGKEQQIGNLKKLWKFSNNSTPEE